MTLKGAGAQELVDGDIHTETLCIIIKIVRGNLTLSLQKTQLLAQLGPSTTSSTVQTRNSEQNDQLTQLNSAEDLNCQLLTSL